MLYLTCSSGFRATANFFRRGSFDSSTAAPAGVNSPELLINRSLNRFQHVTELMSLPARTACNAFLCPSVTLTRFVIPSLLRSFVPNRLSIINAELLGAISARFYSRTCSNQTWVARELKFPAKVSSVASRACRSSPSSSSFFRYITAATCRISKRRSPASWRPLTYRSSAVRRSSFSLMPLWTSKVVAPRESTRTFYSKRSHERPPVLGTKADERFRSGAF